jgi:hypothetical protein
MFDEDSATVVCAWTGLETKKRVRVASVEE